jgi:hypothetical protein
MPDFFGHAKEHDMSDDKNQPVETTTKTSLRAVPRKSRREELERARIGAELRQEERNKRTPAQQIKALDERLGKGVGASSERARLARLGRLKAAATKADDKPADTKSAKLAGKKASSKKPRVKQAA